MKHWLLSILLLASSGVAAQEFKGDKPPKMDPVDSANYYIGVKRDGLEPFWKASVNMPDHEQQFIVNYRDVRKDKDAKLLETLIHPASKACDDGKRAMYFESMRDFYLNETFPDDFKVKLFPVQPSRRWALKERMEFPVAPTHILYIEYKDEGYIEGLQRFIREEASPEKRLYEVMKCPSEASMQAMIVEAERRETAEKKSASN